MELDALLASAPDAIVQLDDGTRVLFANAATGTVLPNVRIGEPWLASEPPEAHERARRAFDTALGGEHDGYESVQRSSDGRSAFVAHRLSPLRLDGRTVGVVLVSRDVTAQKHAELQRLVHDRIGALGNLAATVSHEINNPLAALLMGLDMIVRDLDERRSNRSAASFRPELDDLREAANRTRQIASDLRVFSRPESERPARVDVRSVLAAVVRMVRTDIRQRARLVENYAELPPVEANESLLAQLFLQLMVNAAEAIREGNAADNEVRVEAGLDPQGRVVVAVADSGCGIEPAARAHVFEPFFTTKPEGTGGVGLAAAAHWVQALGGTISFESMPGKGSVFRVTLPAAARAASPVPLQPAAPVVPRRAKVLVVDDESMVVSVVARFLGEAHETVPALSARQALELVNRNPSFDVILCDLMMPHMTGMELHAVLARTHPAQAERMVFMTAGAFTPRARTFLESVPNPRLEKPFDPDSLRSIVERFARG